MANIMAMFQFIADMFKEFVNFFMNLFSIADDSAAE